MTTDDDAPSSRASPLLQREQMARALFAVDAPSHREWADVWLDERERYLSLADTAIRLQPSFRSEVFQAAERANARFGQWMPQQWLEIFIGEMMKEPK